MEATCVVSDVMDVDTFWHPNLQLTAGHVILWIICATAEFA